MKFLGIIVLVLIVVTGGVISVQTSTKLEDTIKDLQKKDEKTEYFLQAIYPPWNRDLPLYSKQVRITAYTSRPEETDSEPYINASNNNVRPGTIAVSRDLLDIVGKFGTKVVLKDYGTFEIADVMNKRYTNSVDIWMGDLTAARLHGVKEGVLIWQSQGD